MIHAKTLVVDREWGRVGSTNLNISSLMGNYELDIVAECDSVTEALAAQFRHDTAQSREIVLLEGAASPRGWPTRPRRRRCRRRRRTSARAAT